METQKIKTAVVILNWNGRKWLEKFLPNLLLYSSGSKVFIADNASTDDSISFVKMHYPQFNIIVNETNGGFSKGYNQALKEINAEYYILLNSDVDVTNEWIPPIIKLMDSDNSVAACQPKVLDFNNKVKFEYAGASGGYIDNLGYPFCRGRVFDSIEDDNGQYDDVAEIFWATGACICLRSSYFWEIGGFDEDFFAHQEEIDLCWRLKNKGYKIMVQPKSFIFHVGGGTLSVGSAVKTYLNFRNNLYMLFKNLPIINLLYVLPIRLVLDGIAALTFIKKKRGVKHFLSIAKAHFVFYYNLPILIKKRRTIETHNTLEGKKKWSVLYRSKLRGKKIFSDL